MKNHQCAALLVAACLAAGCATLRQPDDTRSAAELAKIKDPSLPSR